MITNAIINLAFGLASALVSVLPNGSGFDPSVLAAARTIGGYFGMFAPIAPIGVIATAVGTIFVVEIAIFGWKTVKSLVSHIPQFGGSGH